MPWYMIALLICLVIGPFDALYVYIKAERRRDELRRRQAGAREEDKANPPGHRDRGETEHPDREG